MKILVSETTLSKVITKLLSENYEPNKLYHRETLVKRLLAKNQKGFFVAPKTIRDLVERLPYVDCTDSQGNPATCTRIPEVIHVYLTGRY
jgi:hypothetical protein